MNDYIHAATGNLPSTRSSRASCVLGVCAGTYALTASFFQQLIFNSLTNCLGPRKLLHSGKLYKTKSNKELHGFLFNDFLLLTHMVKQFAVSSGSEKLFSSKSSAQFKMYKMVSAAVLQQRLEQSAGSPLPEGPLPGLRLSCAHGTLHLSPDGSGFLCHFPGRGPSVAGPSLPL